MAGVLWTAGMIELILPDDVVAVDTREDLLEVELFAQEEGAIGNAVEKRRREYITVRACARMAFGKLGLAPSPILSGERGEPLWPAGIVGSITHCSGYRACALARASSVVTIGIDAEPNEPLPDGVLGKIARAEERPLLEELARTMPAVHWDRLLFSAKESVYKAWFPLAKRWLGFEDASLTLDPHAGVFSARLLVEGPTLGDGQLTGFSGRWFVRDGLVLSAIALVGTSPSAPAR
jgi:4'-phosphopantetheinyl transferase EntD